MAKVKNFSSALTENKIMSTFDKTKTKQMNKYDSVMTSIAKWTSYYRANTHVFVEEYLGIKLKLFQIFLLYGMNNNNYFMYIASRGRQRIK